MSMFFFFNDTATTEIYTLSLHDALPISAMARGVTRLSGIRARAESANDALAVFAWRRRIARSEEHTSELQSRLHLVCRLLLEKKKRSRARPTWPRWLRASRAMSKSRSAI